MNNMLIKSTAVAAFLAMTATAQAQSNTSDESATSPSSRSQSQGSGMGNSRSGGGQSSGEQTSRSGQTSGSGYSMQHNMQDMELTGDADKDFAIRMKLHHQQGLEMAQAHLKEGKSPKMKSIAKKMISAQKKEIAQFDKWLESQQ